MRKTCGFISAFPVDGEFGGCILLRTTLRVWLHKAQGFLIRAAFPREHADSEGRVFNALAQSGSAERRPRHAHAAARRALSARMRSDPISAVEIPIGEPMKTREVHWLSPPDPPSRTPPSPRLPLATDQVLRLGVTAAGSCLPNLGCCIAVAPREQQMTLRPR
jgi:hypothetical protein